MELLDISYPFFELSVLQVERISIVLCSRIVNQWICVRLRDLVCRIHVHNKHAGIVGHDIIFKLGFAVREHLVIISEGCVCKVLKIIHGK